MSQPVTVLHCVVVTQTEDGRGRAESSKTRGGGLINTLHVKRGGPSNQVNGVGVLTPSGCLLPPGGYLQWVYARYTTSKWMGTNFKL